MLRALFYLNPNKPDGYAAAKICAGLCEARGISPCFFRSDEPALLAHFPGWSEAGYALAERPEHGTHNFLFVFGGDGTVLRMLDEYVSCEIPVLGINLGRLGFLMETEMAELSHALDQLVAGEYAIERRMMLEVSGLFAGREIHAYATNEVAVSRALSQRMIALDAFVGDTLVEHYIADGVMVASPTGSTAYSLSAGGPIVSPDVSCFVLSPVCPHTLQARPIVLSDREKVRLRINMKEMREGIQLSVDGQALCSVKNQEEVTIARSPYDALLIRLPRERNFFSLLKKKLSQWTL